MATLFILHEALLQFFIHHGYNELDAEGVSFIMGDVASVFKHEGFYGQELAIHVGVGDYSRVAFDMYYRVVIKDNNKVLAEAKTGLICFDYESRKVRSVPAALRAKIGDLSPAHQ